MGLSVCGAALAKGSRNVRFPGTSPSAEGTHEPEILGLSPAIYLKFGSDLSDSSGSGRDGTLVGSGGSYVTALAANVGAGNLAFDTEGTASISVAHATADTALTTSYASPWDGDHTGNRFIADATISMWFVVNALPTGSDKAVLFAKSNTETPGTAASYVATHPVSTTAGTVVAGGSFEAYVDANGALHVEVRSFRGRPARIRTPDGAVTVGATKHLVVQLGYDGVAAWLNGAKLEDGYASLLHVYGLSANILGVTYRNNFAWTIGKAAWGGQADITVDEFAVFLRNPTATISQANVNTLAQQGSTPSPLAHYIWGQLTVNRTSYASIQAAIDDVNSSGGGTVLLNPGTHTDSFTLKSNVRLKKNPAIGGTVTMTGDIGTASLSTSNLGVGTGTFGIDDRDISVSNTRSVGDLVSVRALTNGNGGAATAMRFDRRWSTTAESNDVATSDAELFVVESRTGSALTFEGSGSHFEITQANRQDILAFTPTSWIAMEDLTFTRTSGDPIEIFYTKHGRFVNLNVTRSGTGGAYPFRVAFFCMYITLRSCSISNPSGDGSALGFNTGSKDCVAKDITVFNNARHAVDCGGTANFGPTIRSEFHNITDTSASLGVAGSNVTKYGTHGHSASNIYWNIDCNWGGYNVTGWRHDTRWTRQGLGGEGDGVLGFNDGMGDCYYRDGWHVAPNHWFTAFEGTVGCDRCRFENIQRSATPTGVSHQATNGVDIGYGTGADVNTYSNVDGPHASWQTV